MESRKMSLQRLYKRLLPQVYNIHVNFLYQHILSFLCHIFILFLNQFEIGLPVDKGQK